MTDPAALTMLALEIAPLGDLRDWPPVGALAQQVTEAASGDGGLTGYEVRQARAWAARWHRITPALRAFYVEHATDPLVTHCLRRLLDGGPEPKPGAIGRLAEMWRESRGYDPPFPLWTRVVPPSGSSA